MKERLKNRLILLAKLLVTVALLWYLFHTKGVNLKKSIHILSSSNFFYFVISALLLFFGQFICSYRWKVILDAMDVRLPLLKLFQFYLIGMFFSLFLPSIVGGDFVKIFYVKKESNKSISYALASIYLERACGFLFLILYGIFGALMFKMYITSKELPILLKLGLNKINIVYIPILFLILFIILNIIIFTSMLYKLAIKILDRFNLKHFSEKISIIHEATKIFRKNPSFLVVPLLISAVNIFFVCVENYLIGIGIGIKVSFYAYMIIVSLMATAVMLPISINGIGVRENVFVILFSLLAVDPNHSFSLSVVSFLIVVVTSLPGGIVYSFFKTKAIPEEI